MDMSLSALRILHVGHYAQADHLLRMWGELGGKDPRTVAEVGVGNESFLVSFVHTGARLMAVDAHMPFVEALRKKIPTATVHHCAVSDRKGTEELVVAGDSTNIERIASTGYLPESKITGTATVPADLFSAFDDGTIDVLNIDCEGSEPFVLAHMVSRPKVIMIELLPDLPSSPESVRLLRDMGYVHLHDIGSFTHVFAQLTPEQVRMYTTSAAHRFYSRFMDDGDLCFDIGANAGNRTRTFLGLGASVVAVEPQPHCAQILRDTYASNKLSVIGKAVSDVCGTATLHTGFHDTIASMSDSWLDAVKGSRRFGQHTWPVSIDVETTTLDTLIKEHGVPKFIKIDVEGFEYNVLKGLSQPIANISFEFTPEHIEDTVKCMQHLESLGPVEFNASIGESMVMHNDEYTSSASILKLIAQLADGRAFGDVYARAI